MLPYENRKIVSISLEESTYTLDIAIEKTFLSDWDHYYFSIFQRYKGNLIHISPSVKETNDRFVVFQLSINPNDYEGFFEDEDVVDLVIIRKRGEEESRLRIKSNYEYLPFLTYQVDKQTIIRPKTTREGNISFYTSASDLYSLIEHIELTADGLLHIKGIYEQPGLSFDAVRHIELMVESSVSSKEVTFIAHPMQIPSDYDIYPWYENVKRQGFRATIPLSSYVMEGETDYLKLFLHLKVEKDGELTTIESPRLKVNHLKQKYPLQQKIDMNDRTYRLAVRPTRKSKYLSIRVGEFKRMTEAYKAVRKSWIKVRRSKQLLQLYKVMFYFFGIFIPENKKLVMFESFHGKQFSDNPRALYEYMKKHHKDYTLMWSADRRHVSYFSELNVPYVRRFSIRWLLLMTRAKYWVTNARLPLWIPKPKHTTYIQTWHGTPLKRLAADMEEVHMPGTNTLKYKENFKKEASKWDYLISPNEYSSKIFRRAFSFTGNMLETGYPRNDFLFNDTKETMAHIKYALQIPADKKVILYAPTWRDNQFFSRGRYKFNLQLDLDKLKEEFGDTHIIALRAHYLVAENLDLSEYEGFVYDFSSHADIRDLYLISDLLITDYSSVFFDYANLKRPIIFYVYDIDDYRDHLRGFYFDLEKNAPGPLTKTTDEVVTEIKRLSKEGFKLPPTYEAFYERFCYLEDGNASQRVIDEVFQKQ